MFLFPQDKIWFQWSMAFLVEGFLPKFFGFENLSVIHGIYSQNFLTWSRLLLSHQISTHCCEPETFYTVHRQWNSQLHIMPSLPLYPADHLVALDFWERLLRLPFCNSEWTTWRHDGILHHFDDKNVLAYLLSPLLIEWQFLWTKLSDR